MEPLDAVKMDNRSGHWSDFLFCVFWKGEERQEGQGDKLPSRCKLARIKPPIFHLRHDKSYRGNLTFIPSWVAELSSWHRFLFFLRWHTTYLQFSFSCCRTAENNQEPLSLVFFFLSTTHLSIDASCFSPSLPPTHSLLLDPKPFLAIGPIVFT